MLGLAGVVERLVRRELRLEIIEEIGPVQRPQLEILLAELVLGQQRRKHNTGLSLRVQDSE